MYVHSKRMLIKNAILAGLPPACFAAILPFLEQVTLKERLSLQGPRKPVEHVYFVESGIVSLRTVATEGFVEIATIGSQGAVGISSLLGGHLPAHQSIVLLPGSALRIGTEDFWRVFGESPEFRCRLLRYAQGLAIHEAQTTFCAVRHKLEQRLANWLCLASDVLEGAVLALLWGPSDRRLVVLTHGGGQTRHAWNNAGVILARAGTAPASVSCVPRAPRRTSCTGVRQLRGTSTIQVANAVL